MEYPKIETLFARDGKFVVDTSAPKRPVFASINKWHVTEKIDGTNIRVIMTPDSEITIGGRTDRANIPGDLVATLLRLYIPEKMREVLWGPLLEQNGGELPEESLRPTITIFGEGYGAGIQKGGELRAKERGKNFRAFDVLFEYPDRKFWLDHADIVDVVTKLGGEVVPYLGIWTFDDIVERVKIGVPSVVSRLESGSMNLVAEGVIARPLEQLFDKWGNRIILKLKTKDFGA